MNVIALLAVVTIGQIPAPNPSFIPTSDVIAQFGAELRRATGASLLTRSQLESLC